MSPSSAAFSVEPTMSVKSTVASTRSKDASSALTDRTKRSTSSMRGSIFPRVRHVIPSGYPNVLRPWDPLGEIGR